MHSMQSSAQSRRVLGRLESLFAGHFGAKSLCKPNKKHLLGKRLGSELLRNIIGQFQGKDRRMNQRRRTAKLAGQGRPPHHHELFASGARAAVCRHNRLGRGPLFSMAGLSRRGCSPSGAVWLTLVLACLGAALAYEVPYTGFIRVAGGKFADATCRCVRGGVPHSCCCLDTAACTLTCQGTPYSL